MAHDKAHSVQMSEKGLYCFHCRAWLWERQETINWLYAIETAANDAGEIGDFDAQEFFCDWFAALRDYDFAVAENRLVAQHRKRVKGEGDER